MLTKKVLSIIMCAVLALAFAAGCANNNAPSASTASPASEESQNNQNSGQTDSGKPFAGKTLSFWMQSYSSDPAVQVAFLDEFAAGFEELTGAKVECTVVNWGEAFTKYTLASTGGDAPDVADCFMAFSWQAMGGLLDIDEFFKENFSEDEFYDFGKIEVFVDGKWYGMPWRSSANIALYNTEMFDAAGITKFPETYDELVEVGKALTTYDANGDVDVAGFLFAGGNMKNHQWIPFLAGFGGTEMNADYTKWLLRDEPNRKALKFMQDAIYKENIVPKTVIDPTYDSSDVYSVGKAAILLGAQYSGYNNLATNAPQIYKVTKAAVLPSETGKGPSSMGGAAPVVVFKSTKEPEAAMELLKYFVSTDVQVACMKATGLTSALKAVMADPYFSGEVYDVTRAQFERVLPFDPPIPQASQLSSPDSPLSIMIENVLAGKDIDQEIETAMTAIEKIMAE